MDEGRRRVAVTTTEFERWRAGLTAERQNAVRELIGRIENGDPTLGRPRLDGIRGTRLHKLKEARADGDIRVLLAFDSNRNPVMLAGADANHWDPPTVRLAEGRYLDHERSIGRVAWRLGRREAGRLRDGF